MNIYRGCTQNCAYCDGRAERYRVDGEFGRDVVVKVNAVDLLRRALDPRRRRKRLKRAYVFVGGGINDGYQPLEEKYRLTRGALEVIERFRFPVHLLTKSSLVERDFDRHLWPARISDGRGVIKNLTQVPDFTRH